MPDLLVNDRIVIRESEFDFSFARSSGPGGQNVNKVNSKATLRWRFRQSESLPLDVRARFIQRFGGRLTNDGELLVTSQQYRDQERNITDCLGKLRAMVLEVATPPKVRRKTKPTRGSKERRLQSKNRQSEKKQSRQKWSD